MSENKTNGPTVYLTLSLASGERAENLKESLKGIAKANNRSVSNQCALILQEYVDGWETGARAC